MSRTIQWPRGFVADDLWATCHRIRRGVGQVWNDAVDLTKGEKADFEVESNLASIADLVLELQHDLWCLEEYVSDLRKAEVNADAVSEGRELTYPELLP